MQIGATYKTQVWLHSPSASTTIPWKTDTQSRFRTASGAAAPPTTISAKGNAINAYFLPTAVPDCLRQSQRAPSQIYYGGWASPYTDNYVTDPSILTSVSTGYGRSSRCRSELQNCQAPVHVDEQEVRVHRSERRYQTWNNISRTSSTPLQRRRPTRGTSTRSTIFKKEPRRALQGPAVPLCATHSAESRHRTSLGRHVAGRASPLFKYNRSQLEYDF